MGARGDTASAARVAGAGGGDRRDGPCGTREG